MNWTIPVSRRSSFCNLPRLFPLYFRLFDLKRTVGLLFLSFMALSSLLSHAFAPSVTTDSTPIVLFSNDLDFLPEVGIHHAGAWFLIVLTLSPFSLLIYCMVYEAYLKFRYDAAKVAKHEPILTKQYCEVTLRDHRKKLWMAEQEAKARASPNSSAGPSKLLPSEVSRVSHCVTQTAGASRVSKVSKSKAAAQTAKNRGIWIFESRLVCLSD
ncbi:hypothetical protein L596_029013 [Steinernema carpocapsae]|uniref:Uncharacterized protein n=1 Tax=Steinernema carpocapsae TaxID=34508 RepID=A0A4U5LTD2_STECR|nr:hypothetical protein L596_029013 [Steinernema carpocapsae]